MNAASVRPIGVLMPPELDYSGGLFLPCLSRARLAARVVAAVHAARRRGRPVAFDPGTRGLGASQTAAWIREWGATSALVAAGPHDGTAARMLCEALRRAGIAVPDPVPGNAQAVIERLDATIAGTSPGELAPLDAGFPPADTPPLFCLLDPDASPFRVPPAGTGPPHDPDRAPTVLFRAEGDRLVRVTPGRVPAIPEECREIRLLSIDPRSCAPVGSAPPQDMDERPSYTGRSETLHGVSLPDPAADSGGAVDPWLDACDRLIRRCGRERFRLATRVPRPTAGDDGEGGGAAWRGRYGLEHDAIRRSLWRLTLRHFPERIGFLHALIGFSEIGVDPLEEMYAGNGLPDRNAELLENIVP